MRARSQRAGTACKRQVGGREKLCQLLHAPSIRCMGEVITPIHGKVQTKVSLFTMSIASFAGSAHKR